MSLSIPTLGLFLQNYGDFLKSSEKFDEKFISFSRNIGTKIASVGLVISLVLFAFWANDDHFERVGICESK